MLGRVFIRNMANPVPKVLVAVCEGSEEIETVTPVDLLRRAGAEVTLGASGGELELLLSRGVRVRADKLISEVSAEGWDMVVIPGGPGAGNFCKDSHLMDVLRYQKDHRKWIASICASPAVVLKANGLIEGISATCYPSYASEIPGRSNDKVVVDQNVITSQGPGTSMEFSLELIKVLFGEEKQKEVAGRLLFSL
jgi:protein deglycase